MNETIYIQAVAGAGKSTHIIEQCKKYKKVLVITYTKIMAKEHKLSCGENVDVYTLFDFLYKICVKPYTSEFKGIYYENFGVNFNHKVGDKIRSNHISKIILEKYIDFIIVKLNKYYDCICIDEFQDLSSDELDLFGYFSKSKNLNCNIIAVGDFFQNTFNSSNRSGKNAGVYKSIENYKNYFKENGFYYDDTTYISTQRCSKNVCKFVCENMDIMIDSEKNSGLFYDDYKNIDGIISAIKLNKKFLFNKESKQYNFNASNWGETKGITYSETYVVISENSYKQMKKKELPPTTKNKLYIACTRSSGNVYLIQYKEFKKALKKI